MLSDHYSGHDIFQLVFHLNCYWPFDDFPYPIKLCLKSENQRIQCKIDAFKLLLYLLFLLKPLNSTHR